MGEVNLIEVLEYIHPAECTYTDWVNVGMALQHEGYPVSAWDEWSQRDTQRYHSGECERKWNTFHGASSPVTGATIVQMAKDRGWKPYETKVFDWDDEIVRDDLVIVDNNWIEDEDIHIPSDEAWSPVQELITYLETLFDSTENVGYVTEVWEKDNKYLPSKGHCDRTAGELIQELNKCNGDLGSVFGDYNKEAGAWIRFNPLDGKGVKNENVTDYRYALVESDVMELEKQHAIIKQLELPVACLVYSGGKSLHAIVRVDAQDYNEYRKRVDYLYNVCEKNGLQIDSQNRNPSRLSRMPGVVRKDKKQFLMATNIGKQTWNEWFDWIEGINDDLPNPESLELVWDSLPPKAPPLIEGILRQGHKMLMAGPSKAGKSYALIELCIAIAEGKTWFGWPCTKGRIMYVNLELDRASCLHRFREVYEVSGIEPRGLNNIDIWNLRGKSVPMDKLAPKLIRRAQKKNYIAIVIDPIYKVITGDENSADQMAHFCNQFDKVCTDLGCAVIYCHHHSKGYQGGKRSMDRASGSGVFARDPDALIDLTELEVTEELKKQQENNVVATTIANYINEVDTEYYDDEVSMDDVLNQNAMRNHAKEALSGRQQQVMEQRISMALEAARHRTAWRVEGTLREFPRFEPINLWFDYPVHRVDNVGVLKDIQPEAEKAPWQRAIEKRKTKDMKKEERINSLEITYSDLEMDGGEITVQDLAMQMGVSERTVWNRLKEHGGFKTIRPEDGNKPSIVIRKNEEQ